MRLNAASVWRLRQEQGLAAMDAAAFDAWMADAENARAYAHADAAWRVFDSTDHVAMARMRADARIRMRRRRIFASLAKIAAAVVLVTGGAVYYAAQMGQTYRNDGATAKVVALNDGSRLTLDARSMITVRYDANERHFDLREGQASFQVAHNPARPFRVKVGGATVTALGTTFNIDRWGGRDATITLIQGSVEVANRAWPGATRAVTRLQPGDQVTVEKGEMSSVAKVEPQDVTGWRDGHLVFSDVSLERAVAGLNRYGGAQVKLGSPNLASLRISGVFQAGNATAFSESVARLHGLRRIVRPDGIVLQDAD